MSESRVFPARTASRWVLSAATTLSLFVTGCATTGGRSQNAVIHAKNIVAPALVHIRPVKEVYAQGQRKEVLIVGSGFIISPDGYVVTNEHVAGESKVVRCVLGDKNEVDARVVGVDPYTDLAVLKLDVPEKLPFVRLGDSSKLEAGQTVMAMGSPHGLSRSVSMGIVSVTDRNLGGQTEGGISFSNWIQTDAAINPGNSGGALIDANGHLLGINTAIYSRSGGSMGIGFAIPVTTARQVLEAIVKTGSVTRGYIGVEPQDITAELAQALKLARSSGTLITGVMRGGPADRAGVQPGDIIVNIGDQPVPNTSAMLNLIAQLPPGSAAKIKVLRGSKELELPVIVATRPPPQPRPQGGR